MAALFFAEMRFDPHDPQHPQADRFVLSKGHAAPILYAAWAAAGAFPRDEVLKLRRIDRISKAIRRRGCRSSTSRPDRSARDLRGVGIALNARRIGSDYRTYALLGDGESAEGRRLGGRAGRRASPARQPLRDHRRQRPRTERPTQWNTTSTRYARAGARSAGTRSSSTALSAAILAALAEARAHDGRPTMILARTLKGKGVKLVEGKQGWHGKALRRGSETDQAIAELEPQNVHTSDPPPVIPKPKQAPAEDRRRIRRALPAPPAYKPATSRRRERTATRSSRSAGRPPVVVLDADVKNSTFTKFEKVVSRSVLPDVHRRAGDGRRGHGPCSTRRDSVSVDVRVLPRARDRFHPHGRLSHSQTSSSPARTPACRSARTVRRRWRSKISRRCAPCPNCTVLYPCDGMSAERLIAGWPPRRRGRSTCAFAVPRRPSSTSRRVVRRSADRRR